MYSCGWSPAQSPGTTAWRADGRGPEDRGVALRQRAHHRSLEEERVVVRERRVERPEVVLVARSPLTPSTPSFDERPDPALVLGDDGRVAEIEHLVARVAERGARIAVRGSRPCGETQSMKRTPRACTARISPAGSGIRLGSKVERAVAGLPGVVEQHPADRDLRRLEPRHVLEHLGRAGRRRRAT